MQYRKSLQLALITQIILLGTPVYANTKTPSSELDKVSYSLGVKTAENLNAQQIKINPQQFSNGLTDVINKQKVLMSENEIQQTLTKFQQDQIALLSAREKKMAAENLTKSNNFFASNKTKPGVKTTNTGLQYIVEKSGTGPSPKPTDYVKVNYRGTLLDGTEFDSSYGRKEPNVFQVENLIQGWQEALTLMQPGSKWKVFVPPQLGYGSKGAGNIIEPNSALIFEIELIEVNPKT